MIYEHNNKPIVVVMPNFAKGKIYIIRSSHTDKVYVGSTTYPLKQRFSGHLNRKNECRSKIIIDAGNAYIELLEDYPCQTRNQLVDREQYWIDKYEKQCVNKIIATTNLVSYFEKRKDLDGYYDFRYKVELEKAEQKGFIKMAEFVRFLNSLRL